MLFFEKRPKLRLIFIPIQVLSFIAACLEGTDLPIWILALILLLEGWLIYSTLFMARIIRNPWPNTFGEDFELTMDLLHILMLIYSIVSIIKSV